MTCKCGLPAWQYGQSSQCCQERMLRAMPTPAALYLLARCSYDVSDAFKTEYRDKWRAMQPQRADKRGARNVNSDVPLPDMR